MAAWLLRPYPHDIERVEEFMKGRLIAVGWPYVGSVEGLDRDAIGDKLRETYPNETARWIGSAENDLVNFSQEMKEGDLVLVAPKATDNKGRVLLARITGEYRFDETLATRTTGYAHQRVVEWVRPMIARDHVPDSLTAIVRQRGTTVVQLPEGVLEEHGREKGWLKA